MVPIIPNQRQHKPTAKKRFNDLINYLQGEQGQSREGQQTGLFQEQGEEVNQGRAGLPNEFSELLDYATAPVDTKIQGEKCIAIRTHGVSSIDTASAEMNAVSRKNTRCQDPVYHFILSWPEHEKPAPAEIFDAAEHAIKSLGFENHQYVIAVHANTDNIHCHVAMNRVHPTTFKSRHIEWAKRTLHFAARESEIKHGWTHDNGIYVVEVDGHGQKHIVLNAKRAGVENEQDKHVHPEVEREESLPTWHDPESLDSWLKKSVAKALKEDLQDLNSWQALHAWLDRFDITLRDTGGGGLRLRAISEETGEVLETPLSKGLRLLKRAELEKRWGPFRLPITMPLVVPDFSKIPPAVIDQGIDYVINLAPDGGVPPFNPGQLESEIIEGVDHDNNRVFQGGREQDGRGPDREYFSGTPANPEATARDVPGGGRGVYGVSDGNLAGNREDPAMLLPGAIQDDLGDKQARKDHDLRRSTDSSRQGSSSRARRIIADEFVNGRRTRDPVLREIRKAERAAARVDLKKRYQQYRNFVADGDIGYFTALKALREERTRQNKVLMAEAKQAKNTIPKVLDPAVRLTSIIEIDTEVIRRKLIIKAQYQQKWDALRLTRVPPLQWREWLYEQSNRGDKAALSALRGIVYQAQRDAKLPITSKDEDQELEVSAADYYDQQYKRLMARLLAEERKEKAIRSSSIHMMRPHQVDALILTYAGIQWRVTGNGNVEYSRNDGQHLFTDRGNRVTFDRIRVTDEEIRLALLHSREKFGQQITLTGDDPVFVERMARLADDLGLKVLNPELQSAIVVHRSSRIQVVGEPLEINSTVGDLEQAEQAELEALLTSADQERLRDMVLAIDPRAKFEVANPGDEACLHVGPVVFALEDIDNPMFVQHVGRGRYMIHNQKIPQEYSDQVVEVRYQNGHMAVSKKDKGQSR